MWTYLFEYVFFSGWLGRRQGRHAPLRLRSAGPGRAARAGCAGRFALRPMPGAAAPPPCTAPRRRPPAPSFLGGGVTPSPCTATSALHPTRRRRHPPPPSPPHAPPRARAHYTCHSPRSRYCYTWRPRAAPCLSTPYTRLRPACLRPTAFECLCCLRVAFVLFVLFVCLFN